MFYDCCTGSWHDQLKHVYAFWLKIQLHWCHWLLTIIDKTVATQMHCWLISSSIAEWLKSILVNRKLPFRWLLTLWKRRTWEIIPVMWKMVMAVAKQPSSSSGGVRAPWCFPLWPWEVLTPKHPFCAFNVCKSIFQSWKMCLCVSLF